MDDKLDSCENESELLETVNHFKIINDHAGFELHSWTSQWYNRSWESPQKLTIVYLQAMNPTSPWKKSY